jgi:hypothetical protein
MKRVLRFLIYLYPVWWRRRYGRELEALLEDSGSRWRDVWDLFWGGMEMRMQISKWSFVRIVIVCGIAGLVFTGVGALSMPIPYRYRSTATLKIEPVDTDALNRVVQAAFTPQALSDIIRQEHLYGEAPIDSSIDRFRRAILIRPKGSNHAEVSFAYEGSGQAQRVSQDLIGRIISANGSPSINPNGLRIELDAPPGPPKRQFEGKRLSLAGVGLPAGLLFGVVLALILRRRRARTAN